jgi:hypothetical protein
LASKIWEKVTVLAGRGPPKGASNVCILLLACIDGSRFLQEEGKLSNCLKNRFTFQRLLVYTWLSMLLMLGRFVYSKLKSGLVQELT